MSLHVIGLVSLVSFLLAAPSGVVFSGELPCERFDQADVSAIDAAHLSEALAGSAKSQFEVGLIYEYGRGVTQSDSIARCWYEASASQHHPDAQYRLGVLLDNGWGVEEDDAKAFESYKLASHGGHALAQHDLAMMYFYGTGTARDLVQAYRWLKIANLSGSDLMLKHLRLVAAEMTPLEIDRAESLVELSMNELEI